MKLLLVVVIFAAVTYLAIRWMQDRGHGGPPAQRRSGPRPPTRPVAPDDDDAFLQDLERRKRREHRERRPPDPEA